MNYPLLFPNTHLSVLNVGNVSNVDVKTGLFPSIFPMSTEFSTFNPFSSKFLQPMHLQIEEHIILAWQIQNT